MIPMSLTVRMQSGGRVRGYWLPLFLIWLLLLPIVLLLFPVLLVVGLVVRVNAFRLYAVVWRILASLHDTLIEVESGGSEFRLSIR